MKPIKLAVLAAALLAAGGASAETITLPASLLTARVQNTVHKHRDVVEAAVANSAYGQAMLARYDKRETGPVDSADMWWMLDYDESRALWLSAGQILKDSHREACEGRDEEYQASHPNGEPDILSVRMVSEEVAAVPEADTWAMLLGGLGMIGAVARRRRAS
jgi:MYXO-CTERM domain-containing protein